MHRTKLGFVFVLALLFALGGAAAALAQQAEPPDLQQQAAEDRATLDKEGVIDSAIEVHARTPTTSTAVLRGTYLRGRRT